MLYEKELKLKYITDNRGRKRSVILSIKKFNEIIEDLEDLAAAAERKEETTLSNTKLIQELKKDEII